MKKIITLALLIGMSITQGFAAFKDSGWGARPAGMGGAFTSIADDVNAILYNPSGIGQLKNPETCFMYSKLYTGLDEVKLSLNYFAYGHPLSNGGAWGINWANFTANGLYREDTVALDYAHGLNDMYPELQADVFIGANLKFLRNGYTLDERTKDDPVFADGRYKSALAADLGVIANFESESIGFSVKNLNEPDMGLKETDRIPREYNLGLCYLFGNMGVFEEALAAFDVTYRDKDLNIHLGGESYFIDKTVSARLGGNTREITLGLGYLFNVSGLGLQMDYAFIWPLEIEETSGSHRLSILCRFGKSNK